MTERFNNAVTKLYTAYHEGTLDAMDCAHCAVGNLCGNSGDWSVGGIFELGSLNRISEKFQNNTDYTNQELVTIECIFLIGVKNPLLESAKHINMTPNYKVYEGFVSKETQKEEQFQGLCAVIEYLAELDGIPNPFDFSKLFNEDKQVASSELAILS